MSVASESSTPQRTAQGWSLVAHGDGDVIPLRSFPARIGRQPGLPVRIMHPTVSLQHAELRQAGEIILVDLNSRNGTYVNGKRLTGQQKVGENDLLQFGEAVFRLHFRSRASDASVTCQSEDIGDLALALAQFDKLIHQDSIVPHYQPIVEANTSSLVAYEALARSVLFGLDKPALMFKAAEYFQMEAQLSRLLRVEAIVISSERELPHLFLNTHPAELRELKPLILSLRELRLKRPTQPMTLEVHEAAAVDLNTMKMLRLVLDDLKMGLAYDDFGAGQARLYELVEARPDVLKFDRQLVTGIDSASPHRVQLVESLVQLSRSLGITTLAEGVETVGEAETCARIGFQLIQGYFYGRPEPSSPTYFASPPAFGPTLRLPKQ